MNPTTAPAALAARAGRLILLAALALTAGCAAAPLTYSGFLGNAGDYAALQRVSDRTDASFWRDPQADFKVYHRVVIETPEVFYSQKAGNRRLDPDLKQKLTDEFKAMLVETLKDRYEVVDQPAPDTLRIRAALTEILPTGQSVESLSVIERVPMSLDDAHMEAEVRDSMTATRLLAMVDSRRGRGFTMMQNQVRWSQVRDTLRAWAQSLARSMDAR